MVDSSRNYPAADLNDQLFVTLAQVQTQINATFTRAESRGVRPEEMLDANGNWLLTPLLVAKAQTLAALVQLNASVKL